MGCFYKDSKAVTAVYFGTKRIYFSSVWKKIVKLLAKPLYIFQLGNKKYCVCSMLRPRRTIYAIVILIYLVVSKSAAHVTMLLLNALTKKTHLVMMFTTVFTV